MFYPTHSTLRLRRMRETLNNSMIYSMIVGAMPSVGIFSRTIWRYWLLFLVMALTARFS
jgi:hypothetical protein